jgi:hypothetical protein
MRHLSIVYPFLLLSLLFCIVNLNTTFAQILQGNLTVKQKFFHYEITPNTTGNYQIKIYTLDKANSDNANSTLTYSSQIKVVENNQTLSEVRIFVAQRMGVQWQVLFTDGIRLFVKESRLEYVVMGNALANYPPPSNTVVPLKSTASTSAALKYLAEYFVKNYSQHILENNQTTTQNSTQTGSISTPKATYEYEIIGDWQKAGKAMVYVRQGERGLVYQSLLLNTTTATTHTIKILYAKPKDLSWEIYSSEYWAWTLDKTTQTVSSQKESIFMPPIQPLKNIPYKNQPTEAARIAVEQFIQQCEGLW